MPQPESVLRAGRVEEEYQGRVDPEHEGVLAAVWFGRMFVVRLNPGLIRIGLHGFDLADCSPFWRIEQLLEARRKLQWQPTQPIAVQ